jgi:hypothetical protein
MAERSRLKNSGSKKSGSCSQKVAEKKVTVAEKNMCG